MTNDLNESPIPSWVNVTTTPQLTLTGNPPPGAGQTLSFKIIATGPEGISNSVPLQLGLIPNTAPTIKGSIPRQTAAVNAHFSYTTPPSLFADDFSVVKQKSCGIDGKAPWMNIRENNDGSLTVSGKPGRTHTDTFKDRPVQICVEGTDGKLSTKVYGTIAVTGKSALEIFLYVAFALVGVPGTLLTGWKKRGWIWNTFFRKCIPTQNLTSAVGTQTTVSSTVNASKIRKVQLLRDGHEIDITQNRLILPLQFEDPEKLNVLHTTFTDAGIYTLYFIGAADRILEKVKIYTGGVEVSHMSSLAADNSDADIELVKI